MQENSKVTVPKQDRRENGKRFIVMMISLIILVVVFNVARDSTLTKSIPARYSVWVKWGIVALWVISGTMLYRNLENAIFSVIMKRRRLDDSFGLVLHRALSALGYGIIAIEALHLLDVKVVSILVGGAVTGVIVGIGAQSTLSNLFAGVILFTLHPFSIGQTIIIRSSLFGGIDYTGAVVDVNWFHTIIVNEDNQRVIIPNSTVIVSAVTIVSSIRIQRYVISLPYSVSLQEFQAKLQHAAHSDVTVRIADFGDSTYSVHLEIPLHVNRDVLRQVIGDLKAPPPTPPAELLP